MELTREVQRTLKEDSNQEIDEDSDRYSFNEENNVKFITPSRSRTVNNTEVVGGEIRYLSVPCVKKRREPVRNWKITCRVYLRKVFKLSALVGS